MCNNLITENDDKFVNLLSQEIKTGSGITPFVGSGVSSNSGILMGQEFYSYLGYVVYVCVYKDQKDRKGKKKPRWSLKENGWPDIPDSDEYKEPGIWACEMYKRIAERKGYKIDLEDNKKVKDIKIHRKSITEPDFTVNDYINIPPLPDFICSSEWEKNNMFAKIDSRTFHLPTLTSRITCHSLHTLEPHIALYVNKPYYHSMTGALHCNFYHLYPYRLKIIV